MSVIVPPDFKVSSFKWTLKRNEVEGRSVFGSQSIEASTPLWVVAMTGGGLKTADAIAFEQFLEALAGKRNQVAIHHQIYPQPLGTMRGTLTLSSDAADGATSLVITGGAGQSGKTLLRGDLLGLGTGLTQQVVRVSADATANGSGVITVTLNTALRNAFSSGAAVTWDRPKALFRQSENNSGIEYTSVRYGQPWALDLIEDVRA